MKIDRQNDHNGNKGNDAHDGDQMLLETQVMHSIRSRMPQNLISSQLKRRFYPTKKAQIEHRMLLT